jgi:uncharacterized membrane protein YsdA (DUF1294 family)
MQTRSSMAGTRPHRSGRVGASAILLLVLLLVVPSYAVSRLSALIDWRLLIGGPVLWSVFAFFSYRSDKRRAEAGEWRIAESTLHMIDFLGGWPGAFLAQRKFRHKTSKVSFQFVFWAIVLTHQFLAVDSLCGWKFSKDAWRLIKSQRAYRTLEVEQQERRIASR